MAAVTPFVILLVLKLEPGTFRLQDKRFEVSPLLVFVSSKQFTSHCLHLFESDVKYWRFSWLFPLI